MPAEDRDPLVEGGVRDNALFARQDGGERHAQTFGERDKVVHRDPAAAEDRGNPLGPLADLGGAAGGDRAGHALEIAIQVAKEVPQPGVAVALAQRGITVDGHLERARRQPTARRADAVSAGRKARGHVGRRQAQGGVAHGPKSTSEARRGGYHRPMPDRDPGEVPPRRLLAHAPSERYAASQPARGGGRATGGAGTAILLGLVAAGIGSAVHVAIAVLFLATGGLLVVAATLGFVVGAVVRYGAGSRMRTDARRVLGMGLAVAAVAVALAANWGLSGAYLGPIDFLDQVYGLLVPLQVVAAAAGALAGTR